MAGGEGEGGGQGQGEGQGEERPFTDGHQGGEMGMEAEGMNGEELEKMLSWVKHVHDQDDYFVGYTKGVYKDLVRAGAFMTQPGESQVVRIAYSPAPDGNCFFACLVRSCQMIAYYPNQLTQDQITLGNEAAAGLRQAYVQELFHNAFTALLTGDIDKGCGIRTYTPLTTRLVTIATQDLVSECQRRLPGVITRTRRPKTVTTMQKQKNMIAGIELLKIFVTGDAGAHSGGDVTAKMYTRTSDFLFDRIKEATMGGVEDDKVYESLKEWDGLILIWYAMYHKFPTEEEGGDDRFGYVDDEQIPTILGLWETREGKVVKTLRCFVGGKHQNNDPYMLLMEKEAVIPDEKRSDWERKEAVSPALYWKDQHWYVVHDISVSNMRKDQVKELLLCICKCTKNEVLSEDDVLGMVVQHQQG